MEPSGRVVLDTAAPILQRSTGSLEAKSEKSVLVTMGGRRVGPSGLAPAYHYPTIALAPIIAQVAWKARIFSAVIPGGTTWRPGVYGLAIPQQGPQPLSIRVDSPFRGNDERGWNDSGNGLFRAGSINIAVTRSANLP